MKYFKSKKDIIYAIEEKEFEDSRHKIEEQRDYDDYFQTNLMDIDNSKYEYEIDEDFVYRMLNLDDNEDVEYNKDFNKTEVILDDYYMTEDEYLDMWFDDMEEMVAN